MKEEVHNMPSSSAEKSKLESRSRSQLGGRAFSRALQTQPLWGGLEAKNGILRNRLQLVRSLSIQILIRKIFLNNLDMDLIRLITAAENLVSRWVCGAGLDYRLIDQLSDIH